MLYIIMSKKFHILYTIPNFDTAGSGKVVYDLAKHLDRRFFKISIVCNHNRGLFFKEVARLDVTIHQLPFAFPVRPYYSLLSRLKPFKDFLKQEQVDLVHSWHWASDWTEPLACKLMGVPFIYTKKSMGWGHRHWKIRTYLSRFVITVNTDMHAFFPYKKAQQLISFGLDMSHYDSKKVFVEKNVSLFKVVTVANLVAVKNIEYLIDAIHKLKHLPIQLEIVGDFHTAYAGVLMQKVETLQMTNQVQFAGKKQDVRPVLAAADLYVICSKQEGMPMALVEAMAMGCPVLGSDVPGVRYVLKDFEELLFELDDLDTFVSLISKVYRMTQKDRIVLGEQLRTYCLDHFTIDQFINQHEALYLDIVKPIA